jgi:hypothetical protein
MYAFPPVVATNDGQRLRRGNKSVVNVTQSEIPAMEWGAYGLRIDVPYQVVNPSLVVPADPTWPLWTLAWEPTDAAGPDTEPAVESWSPDRAELVAHPYGRVTVDRATARTTFHLPEPPTPEALLHPYLASTGVIANHWLGRTPFHAGAFAHEGRSWGVLGAREMGKSSLLMSLHRAELTVLSDDLLVIDGAMAYSGPRCLDLRQSAAERFEEGTYLGVVGTRERWRVTLPPVASELPFGGWVLLDWADRIAVDQPATSVRLEALLAHTGITAPGVPTMGLLDLVAVPMLRLSRPRDWSWAAEALDRLLEAISLAIGTSGR